MFSSLEPFPFPDGRPDGSQFWQVLAAPRPFTRAVMRGRFLPRLQQDGDVADPSAARIPDVPPIPAIAVTTLPHLTDDPGALLAWLSQQVPDWPGRPVADHYRELFAVLSRKLTRRVAVERSGYSLRLIPRLRALFPEARFVHLYRDGPDTALSMSRHPLFRMIRIRAERAGRGDEGLSAKMAQMFREGDTDVRSLLEEAVPIEAFGRLWSDAIISGLAHLAQLPALLRMSMAFEGLLDDPDGELTRLAAFLGVEPLDSWLAAARAELDGTRRQASLSLPPDELAALQRACAPGTAALLG